MKKTVTIKLEIESHEDESDLQQILNAHNAFMALSEIREEIFRPARKHGYSDPRLAALLDGDPKKTQDASNCRELVALLEERFNEILYERELKA